MKVFTDSDMLLFTIMSANQKEWQINDEEWSLTNDIGQCRCDYLDAIDLILHTCNAKPSDLFQCFTGPSAFRKRVYSEYKANRIGIRKPIGYTVLKAELLRDEISIQHDEIEADDAIGILASRAYSLAEQYVVCSGDKDLNQIPGTHYWTDYWKRNTLGELPKSKQSLKDFLEPYGLQIYDNDTWVVSPLAAQAFWYSQILSGDSTDNISGCPGIGEVRARRCVEEMDLDSPVGCWEKIVQQFERAKAPGGKMGSFFPSKKEALACAIQQAQLVRILRNVEYDWTACTVDLWHPDKLTPMS